MTLTIFQFFNMFITGGFVAFGAKFIENQFAQTSSLAGILWGKRIVFSLVTIEIFYR